MTSLSPNGGKHTARAHFHASLTLFLAPLAVLAGVAWVSLKAFVCWNSRSSGTEQQLCQWAFVLPDTVLLCAGACFTVMLWSLAKAHEGADAMAAVRNSYHTLENRHRRRVKGASASLIVGASLFVAAASWYLLELAPGAAFVGAAVLTGGAYAFGKYVARAR